MLDNQQLLCGDTGWNMVYNRIGVCGDFGPNKKDYGLGVTQPIGSWIWRLKGDLYRDGFKELPVAKAQQIMLITLFQILVNLNERAKQDTLVHQSLTQKEYHEAVQALQGEVGFMQKRVAKMLPWFGSPDNRINLSGQCSELRQRYAYYASGHRSRDSKREGEMMAINRYCAYRVPYDGSFMYDYARMVYRYTGLYSDDKTGYVQGHDARRSIYDTQSGRRTIEVCKLIEAVKTPRYGADLYANALLRAIEERKNSYVKEVKAKSR